MKRSMLHRHFATLLLTMGLMGCSSQKSFQEDPPFQVAYPTSQMWMGGREASGAGMELRLRYTPGSPGEVRPDSLYFRGQIMPAVVEDTETGMLVTASFRTDLGGDADRVMHADARREVGNQPPKPLPAPDFPFDLEPDQAVLSYIRLSDGKRFYVRVDGVKEKPARVYPGKQRQ